MSPALPWQRQVRVVDTWVWGLSQTRIAPLAFMFLFIIITVAYTWNGGNEKTGYMAKQMGAAELHSVSQHWHTAA